MMKAMMTDREMMGKGKNNISFPNRRGGRQNRRENQENKGDHRPQDIQEIGQPSKKTSLPNATYATEETNSIGETIDTKE